ncbi:MAG: oligosaccharide flippase family protein [Bacteroidales bacterium]|nr:oligosaccharide flippase family protein [Bacteroidales bacterium]
MLTKIQRKEFQPQFMPEIVTFDKNVLSVSIIEKQGLQGTILTYSGVVIGFITAGYLLPKYLTQEQNGVLDVINAWSLIFATLATLGINNVSNRLFPWFRNQKNHHNGYLGILFIVLFIGLLLSTGLYLILRPYILSNASETGKLLPQFVDLIIPLSVFTALFLVIDIYYAVLYKSIKGILHKELLQRVYILIAIAAYLIFAIDFPLLVLLYIAALSLPGLLILFSLIRDGEFVLHINKDNLTKDLKINMFSVASFGIIVSFSNILIQKIDILMIQHFLGTVEVGTYGRVFFYGTLVVIPLRVLSKISAVVVAQAWKDKDLKLISRVYNKSTIDQLIIGSLVLIGLWANIDNVIHILGPQYASGKYVVLFIGFSNLFLMAAGVSGAIISTSDYYKVLTIFVGIFGALVILSNSVFIPAFGISGAALASAISALIYSIMRFGFLWSKFKMQPYSYKHLLIILAASLSFGLNLLLPVLYNADNRTISIIADVLLRSSAIAISYIILIYLFKLSPDLENWIKKFSNKSE